MTNVNPKSSLDSKLPASIDARLGDGTDTYVLIRRDLSTPTLVNRSDGLTSVQALPDHKSLPAVVTTQRGSVLEGTELKSFKPGPLLGAARAAMSGMRRSKRGGAVKIRLCTKVSLNTSAAAITTVIPVEPSTTSEWSSIATLFDEVKVTGAELHYRLDQTVAPAGAALMVMSYDPLNSSALGSTVAGCEFRQHQLSGLGVPAGAQTPASVNEAGLRVFHVRIPKGSARTSGAAATFGDEWSATGDASDVYGWIKPYVEASSSGTIELNGMLYIHCLFRSRS